MVKHAWLMGTVLREARSTVRWMWTLPSQALRRVFCCPEPAQRTISRRHAGTGDPDPGARAWKRARPSARGLPEGTRRWAGYRWQSELWRSSQLAAHLRRRTITIESGLPPVCGSTDAGGEDFGYFVAKVKRVRIPPLTHALWRRPARVATRHSAGLLKRRFVLRHWKPISPVPQRTCQSMCKRRQGGGEDVCYFG